MNITAGKGGSAWQPSRMLFEAHNAPPFGTPDETFDASAITVSLSLGGMGTLRSGNLGLSVIPPAWEGQPWPRMIRARIISEHGTGYIAAGIAEAAIQQRGELSGIPLSGIEGAFLGRPGDGTAALSGAGLTPGGSAAYGVEMPTPDNALTRRDAVDKALEPYPNSEAGVSADLKGIIGRPEEAEFATYALDDRAFGFRSLGWTVSDYLTDASYKAGPDFPLRTYSRPDVPPFAPRRHETITMDPQTTTRDEFTAAAPQGAPLNTLQDLNGTAAPVSWLFVPYTGAGNMPVNTSVLRGLKIRARFELIFNSPEYPVDVALRVRRNGGADDIWARAAYTSAGVFTQEWELPSALWDPSALQVGNFETIQRVEIYFSSAVSATGTGNQVKLLETGSVGTYEYERAGELVFPRGWVMPYAVGPTYEFTLPGVHVPPLRITGLPGGVTQFAAGAVITWHKNEASTKILTGALPYKGSGRRR